MNFRIEKKEFLKPLSIVQGIAEKRSSIPALSNVLLESEESSIRLTTTDLETAMIADVPCSVTAKGKLCISARKLYEIVRELPEAQISVQGMENDWAKITCKSAVFNLSGIEATEFPSLPSYSEKDFSTINSFDLREMIEKVIFAASTEESRYHLNGIFFESVSVEGAKVARMVATDGHRLALIDREGPEFSDLEKGAIVPKRGLNEVRKIVGEYSGELRLSVNHNSFVVKLSPFIIIIRLIDGEFPDYRQVIPAENDKIVKLETRGFASCLRRVSTISTDRVEGIKFTLKAGAIELYSSSQDIGNAMEEFPAVYDGGEINVGFNARYMLEALNEIDEDELFLELKDETSAIIMRPASGRNPLYVIMPMRV